MTVQNEQLSRLQLPEGGSVSASLVRPTGSQAIYVMAHGAGAPMTHPFMERISLELARRRIATLRFNFQYADLGKKRPDRPAALQSVVQAAIDFATAAAPELPLFLGGKSMGGRMASQLMAKDAGAAQSQVKGIIFLGFPLHPPEKPGITRAEHLREVRLPMLFVQGARDKLANLELLKSVLAPLGEFATLHLVQGADHGFEVRKLDQRSVDSVFVEICDTIRNWIEVRF